MKAVVVLILSLLVVFSSCARMPDQYPSDFNVVLNWDTGALPPVYHYQYSITIGPGLQGKFVYSHGYIEDNPDAWVTSFDLTSNDLQSLYDYLKQNDIFRNQWKMGQPLLGGQGTGIVITASGKQYQVPSVSEVDSSEWDQIEQAIEEIGSFVPQSIWDEMNARQLTYEQQNSD